MITEATTILLRNDFSPAFMANNSLEEQDSDDMAIILKEMEELSRLQSSAAIFVPMIISLLFLLGVVANALVVYVTISTNRTSKHPIHSIFVLNLAVADVLYLVVSAPYYITILVAEGWRFGEFLCPVIPFISTTTVAASIYTISALAWIRFMALIMPFRFRRSCISTRKAGYVVVVAIWIASAILSIPFLIYYRAIVESMTESATACRWIGPDHAQDVYAITRLTATYICPMILVTFFYAVVGREVLCYMVHRNSAMNRGASDERKECIKSTVVVLSLILAFLLCWLGRLLETIFKICNVLDGQEYASERAILGIVTRCFAYAHAFVNPFIYTFASPIFRRNLRSSFREKFRNCRNSNSICANGRAASIVQRRPDSRQNLSLAFDKTEGGTYLAMSCMKGNGAVTPKTEQLQMLTVVDSHSNNPTETTRLASPEISNGTHQIQTSLLTVNVDSDEKNRVNDPMISVPTGSEAAAE